MYVKIAINLPMEVSFTYSVPENLRMFSSIGKRALVPFGRRQLTGYIIAFQDIPDIENIRDILDILDADPLFTPDDLSFYSWAASYYHYPLGKALHEILPGGIDLMSDRIYKVVEATLPLTDPLPERQQILLDFLEASPKGISSKRLQKLLNIGPIRKDLDLLVSSNRVMFEECLKKPLIQKKMEQSVTLAADCSSNPHLSPRQQSIVSYLKEMGAVRFSELRTVFKSSSPIIRQLLDQGVVSLTEREVYRLSREHLESRTDKAVNLNDDQIAACRTLEEGIDSKQFRTYLLHGVTGSGKTEVYFSAIENALAAGHGVLYLVPEIALTPQLISRVQQRFPQEEIAVLHSDIAQGIRYDYWRRIQKGEIHLVVGARSAIFAPLVKLRLIVVDEEHDPSYKQDVRMRYSARDLAVVRAKMQSAVVVLGSATPDIRTFYSARQGKYAYLSLPSRVENRPLPEVEIVDMKTQQDETGQIPVLSETLITALRKTFLEGRQALLFLNRRGYHTFLFCPDCGASFSCPNCAVSLTLHAKANQLRCHYCDYSVATPSFCPKCNGRHISFYGAGTERLEKEISEAFPHIRTARMDRDTTIRRGAHTRILKAFERREYDLLVGTQMITKGHDFANVTLVGVISADISLNLPDFRSAERTFQLLTQVSGRGGRGSEKGYVVIQTFNPDHYAIFRAKNHDYPGFIEDELIIRKSLDYPPFSRLINLQLSSLKEDRGRMEAEELGRRARIWTQEASGSFPAVEIIGPAEAPITRIKNRYRWQILLKSENLHALHALVRHLTSTGKKGALDIKVDIDPFSFM
ncbi:MAG: Primosomal protein N' [Syntrophus sp. PtaU1.Bin208]|nr:MAG: Primosomal protein N' [Syntrophus sp. PtaU1.Bin208]